MLSHPRPTLTPTLIKPVIAWSCKWINSFCHSVTHTDQLNCVTQISQRSSVTDSIHSKNEYSFSVSLQWCSRNICLLFCFLFFWLYSSTMQCSTLLWQGKHEHCYPSSYTEDFFGHIFAIYIKMLINRLMVQDYFVLELQKCFQKL